MKNEVIETLLNQSDDEYARLIEERISAEKSRGSQADKLLVALFSEKLRARTFKVLGRLLLQWEDNGLVSFKKKLIFFIGSALNVDALINSFNSANVWTALFNKKNEALALLEMFTEIRNDFLEQAAGYLLLLRKEGFFLDHLNKMIILAGHQQLALKNALELEKVQEIIESNKKNSWEESKNKVFFSCYRCLVPLVQQNKYHNDAIAVFRELLKQASPTLLDRIEKDFNSYNKTSWDMCSAMQILRKKYPQEFSFRLAAVNKMERAISDSVQPLIPPRFFRP